jgi:hypothetical protein
MFSTWPQSKAMNLEFAGVADFNRRDRRHGHAGVWLAAMAEVADGDAAALTGRQGCSPSGMPRGHLEALAPAGIGPLRQQPQPVPQRIDAGARGALVDEALHEEAVRVVAGSTVLAGEDVRRNLRGFDAHVRDGSADVCRIVHAEHHRLPRRHMRDQGFG